MIAETLMTPHRAIAGEEYQQQLLASLDPEGIKETFQEIENPADRDQASLAATDFIVEQVRAALRFPVKDPARGVDDFREYGISHPVSLEATVEHQMADCTGYTIATSEALEAAGIDHWVGFANGHGLLLSHQSEGRRVYITDPLSPELNQPLEPATVGKLPEIPKELDENSRAVLTVNGFKIAAAARGDTDTMLKKHPWLTPVGSKSKSLDISQYLGPRNILMSVYEATTGREVLAEYQAFHQAVGAGNYEQASRSLHNMGGLYPEIDARVPHKGIKKVIAMLGRRGEAELAIQAFDDYFDSFAVSKDSRLLTFQGDCLRILATEAGIGQAALQAVEVYEQARQQPRAFRTTLDGKLRAAQGLAAQIGLQQTVSN